MGAITVGMVAGEVSGNLLGAGLLQELQQQRGLQTMSGIGGADMIAAGFESFYDIDRLAVMGLIEPLGRLPELIKIRRHLYQHFSQQKPDVFIGIDAPDFNLGLEGKLRKAGVPVVHYVSPSVWAWRKKRIHKIARSVDLVLTLLPFEAAFYAEHDVPACFVGHPLADLIPLEPNTLAAREKLNLDPNKKYIALLPGSRRNEIKLLAETFIKTAQLCQRDNVDVEFITSAANDARDQEFQALCRLWAPELKIRFFHGCTHAVMAAADVVLVTSGTATLETMLFKKPMVIAYRLGKMTYHIARHLVKIPHMGLPNLLANARVVPEFMQDQATPENLARALQEFLHDASKTEKLQATFLQIHKTLRQDANKTAAAAILKLIEK